jgi:hypothetical protein
MQKLYRIMTMNNKKIASDILHIAKLLLSESNEEDSNFNQKLIDIRKNFRGLLVNKNKTLKKLGIRNPINPRIRIEDLIDLVYQFTKPIKTSSATAIPEKSSFFDGLKTLRNKKKATEEFWF